MVPHGIVIFNIGGYHVDVRGKPFKNIQDFRDRAAGRVMFAGNYQIGLYQPDIDIHRHIKAGFPCFSHTVNIGRNAPGGHKFTCRPSEYLRPATGLLTAGFLPGIIHLPLARGFHRRDERFRHGAFEYCLSFGTVITVAA